MTRRGMVLMVVWGAMLLALLAGQGRAQQVLPGGRSVLAHSIFANTVGRVMALMDVAMGLRHRCCASRPPI
jgi:hypothetical protein